MDFNAIAEALKDNPLAMLLALALGAIVWLYKQNDAKDAMLLETVKAMEQSHRETIMRVIPLAEKLITAADILERITTSMSKD